MKPFLRWVGGKGALLEQLRGLLPKDPPKTYCEPFLGSGAMFLDLGKGPKLDKARVILNDMSALAGAAWAGLDPANVTVRKLQELLAGSRTYTEIREEWNAVSKTDLASLAHLALWLNGHSFNGVTRENLAGDFNVPQGDRMSFKFDADNYKAIGKWVRDHRVVLCSYDFESIIDQLGDGDFVFADPPYDGAFDKYTAAGFNHNDQIRLRDALRRLHKRGGMFLITNGDTENVRHWYRGLVFTSIAQRVSVNRDGGGRAPVSDLAITNYKPVAL